MRIVFVAAMVAAASGLWHQWYPQVFYRHAAWAAGAPVHEPLVTIALRMIDRERLSPTVVGGWPQYDAVAVRYNESAQNWKGSAHRRWAFFDNAFRPLVEFPAWSREVIGPMRDMDRDGSCNWALLHGADVRFVRIERGEAWYCGGIKSLRTTDRRHLRSPITYDDERSVYLFHDEDDTVTELARWEAGRIIPAWDASSPRQTATHMFFFFPPPGGKPTPIEITRYVEDQFPLQVYGVDDRLAGPVDP